VLIKNYGTLTQIAIIKNQQSLTFRDTLNDFRAN
jgi:hypothetical protein